MAGELAIQYYGQDQSGGYSPQYADVKGNPISPADLQYYEVVPQEDIDSGKVELSEQEQKDYDTVYLPQGQRDQKTSGSTAGPRSMSNNFGYAHKPGFMGLATMAPGPVGLAMKAASVAMNVNNRQAVQKARETLGFAPKANLGSIVSDNKGLVGNINIDTQNKSETVPVGFELSDKQGRTMMTPNEARMRQQVNPGTVTESKPQDVNDAARNFKQSGLTAPKTEGGMLSKFGGSIFGTKDQENDPDHVSKGLGLYGLSPSFRNAVENGTNVAQNSNISGVNYAHPDRGDVTKGLTDRSVETMSALAGQQPGGINVSSAYRSPDVNAAIGGAAKSYHQTGQAFDVSTKGLTDQEKRDLTERSIMAGAMEIGTYGDQSLHVATDRRNPMNAAGVAAMYNRTESQLQNAPGWFQSGVMESHLAPTPTARPDDAEVKQMKDDQISAPTDGRVPGLMSSLSTDTPNAGTYDASKRFSDMTPADSRMMAMTLAGEIDPTRTDLSSDTAQQEARGILSTVENRTARYGDIAGVLSSPKQYSTWNNETAAQNAIKNYNLNPDVYDGMVKSYMQDPDSNLGFTNYHATQVNPGWGPTMSNPQTIGAHTFGSLAEFGDSLAATKQNEMVATNSVPTPQEKPSVQQGLMGPGPMDAADASNSYGPQNTGQDADTDAGPSGSVGGNKSDSSGPQGAADNSNSSSGGFASAARGGAVGSSASQSSGPSSSASQGGGFTSAPSSMSNNSDNDNDSGYGGSRSDGWR